MTAPLPSGRSARPLAPRARWHRLGSVRSLPALCLLGLLLLGSSPAGAAERGFELGAEAKSALSGIQDLWAQWLAAMEKDEYRRASTVFEQLHGSHLDLGMRALPDLALAA